MTLRRIGRQWGSHIEIERAASRNWNGWHAMDPDVVCSIAHFLDCRDLLQMEQVCRGWRHTFEQRADLLWQPLLCARFPRAAKLMELMPTHPLQCKALFLDQLQAERTAASAVPTPKCSLSDFCFTFELVREPSPPFKVDDRIVFTRSRNALLDALDAPCAPGCHVPMYIGTFAEGEEQIVTRFWLHGDRWWFQYQGDETHPFKWAPCDLARPKTPRSAPEPVDTQQILHTWTGRLDGPEFKIPCPWSAWEESWSTPSGSAPIRLRAFVTRALEGSLRTVRCFLSATRPDIDEWVEDAIVVLGQSLTYVQTFKNDHFKLEPQISFVMQEDTPHALEGTFEICDKRDSGPMSKDQFLRYLEFGLPWSGV
jgi:hypothetical protein